MKSIEKLKQVMWGALAPVRKMSVSEWADSYRKLPTTAAEPGQWRTSRVPYARAIMDAFTDAEVERVVAMTSAQVSKTECALNVIGRYAHLDPCNIMLVEPTLSLAQDISKDRIINMINDSEVLKNIFSESKTRNSNQTILNKQFRGGRLVITGANSATDLSSRPIRLLLCDEVDRFPASIPNEGDPVKLAIARTTSYWNAKIGLFSTPTVKGASRIELEYLTGSQEEWQHACPNCGEYHKLEIKDFVGYKWHCPDCGLEFSEREIKSSAQKYIAQKPEEKKVRSFWVNAFSSPWLSWEKIIDEWNEARGNAEMEKVVSNTRFGESYEYRYSGEEEAELLARRQEYPAEIPFEVKVLTAAVDVQANRLEYEVVGWSESASYGIKRGVILGRPTQAETWLSLDDILDAEYKYADGRALKVARTFIDSGYSTKIVYEYCQSREIGGRYAIKGRGAAGLPLIYKYTAIQGYGIEVAILGVNDGKAQVMSNLRAGRMKFPIREGYDENYFKQLLSEKQVMKRASGISYVQWQPVEKNIRNESLDLAVYNLACMKSLNINWQRQVEEIEKQELQSWNLGVE